MIQFLFDYCKKTSSSWQPIAYVRDGAVSVKLFCGIGVVTTELFYDSDAVTTT